MATKVANGVATAADMAATVEAIAVPAEAQRLLAEQVQRVRTEERALSQMLAMMRAAQGVPDGWALSRDLSRWEAG